VTTTSLIRLSTGPGGVLAIDMIRYPAN